MLEHQEILSCFVEFIVNDPIVEPDTYSLQVRSCG